MGQKDRQKDGSLHTRRNGVPLVSRRNGIPVILLGIAVPSRARTRTDGIENGIYELACQGWMAKVSFPCSMLSHPLLRGRREDALHPDHSDSAPRRT